MYGLVAAALPWKPNLWSCLWTVVWANLKAAWRLEFCSNWLFKKSVTSLHYAPQDQLTPLHQFTWPTTLWLSECFVNFSIFKWQLTVKYFGARKCHAQICCTGGILWQFHAGIHWAHESDPFFSRIFVKTIWMHRCLILYTCVQARWFGHLILIIWMSEQI